MTKTLNLADLAHFTGSEHWYRHALNRSVLFTDGAKHVADAGGAYWLLDEIALTQLAEPKLKGEEFQAWTLTRKASGGATLVCDDGNGNPLFAKEIAFTDFPLDTIALWFCDNTILLPSEY